MLLFPYSITPKREAREEAKECVYQMYHASRLTGYSTNISSCWVAVGQKRKHCL